MLPVTEVLKNHQKTKFQTEVIPEKEDTEEEKNQATKPEESSHKTRQRGGGTSPAQLATFVEYAAIKSTPKDPSRIETA